MENKIKDFLELKLWKVILTILFAILAYFFLGPRTYTSINDPSPGANLENFNAVVSIVHSPVGISDPYIFILLSLIVFYLAFSLIWLIAKAGKSDKRIKRGKRK